MDKEVREAEGPEYEVEADFLARFLHDKMLKAKTAKEKADWYFIAKEEITELVDKWVYDTFFNS